MIEHYWTVLCRKGVIDSDSNNISLHEVLEQLNIIGVPPGKDEYAAIPGPYEVVSLWGRSNYNEPAKGTARYVIVYEPGKDQKASEKQLIEIDLTKHNRSRSKLSLSILPILGEGLHRIQVALKMEGESDWREITSLPYEVRFQTPEKS